MTTFLFLFYWYINFSFQLLRYCSVGMVDIFLKTGVISEAKIVFREQFRVDGVINGLQVSVGSLIKEHGKLTTLDLLHPYVALRLDLLFDNEADVGA